MNFLPTTKEDLVALLSINNEDELKELYKKAKEVRIANCSNTIYYRGLIEISNQCKKDCYYCGIRCSNKEINRYCLNKEEVLKAASFAYQSGFGSVAIQGGEKNSKKWELYIEEIILAIGKLSQGKLGITLSLGEQSKECYKRWFDAGAHRYLLRIETSNKDLYKTLHPMNHSYDNRVKALHLIKETGYQLGTGVMCGLPGQTINHLANDIIFFKTIDADMIGLGPFIPHHATPLSSIIIDKKYQLTLALKVLATTRLYLKNVNMVASTALQALDPYGRELGCEAGANIIMPNLTDAEYKVQYQLYEGKPNLAEFSLDVHKKLDENLIALGNLIGYNQWGDSPHALKKQN